MALLISYKCADVVFDVYNNERVPVGVSKNKYFVTPNRIDKIEFWMKNKGLQKITNESEINELISIGLIGEYKC